MATRQRQKRPKILHIFRFKERYELDGYERKNGLEFTREFTTPGGTKSNEATTYHLQLDELKVLAGKRYYEALGVFVSIRTMVACYERVYRGYLLDATMQPLTTKRLARRLHMDPKRLQSVLALLIEVNLIERVDCPDFASLEAEETELENVSKHSETFSNPSKGKKNGNGKGLKGKEKKKNGKVKQGQAEAQVQEQTEDQAKAEGQLPNQDQSKGQAENGNQAQAEVQPEPPAETARPPTTTPPYLPTEADARGSVGPDGPKTPWKSDMAAELAEIERRLRGSPPQASEGRYSDRANLFATEIYMALGLQYGRTMAARERGCFAARWTEAELVGLPPPMAEALWDHAVLAAGKLRKKRRVKKPGGMFCRIWAALLAQAKAGVLA